MPTPTMVSSKEVSAVNGKGGKMATNTAASFQKRVTEKTVDVKETEKNKKTVTNSKVEDIVVEKTNNKNQVIKKNSAGYGEKLAIHGSKSTHMNENLMEIE